MSVSIRRGLVLALAVAGALSTAVAEEASRLETLMGSEAFRASGLDQQSPEQLRRLEDWLYNHAGELRSLKPASEASSATAVAERKAAPDEAKPAGEPKVSADEVHSRIAGAFNGWSQGKVLVLQNGQKWRVSDASSLVVSRGLDAPEVTVKRGFMGIWFIKVKGYNTTAQVKPEN
ncbi:hypothetical protein [Tahibacter amnicola]|uniref:Secreted protein n=1 Tax=Tahibacter amnicola TaxID=2976241 RepID=A0ABY6BJR5_9GAMM|nr:hypothetical protein [Tahibacter amnicola]UXI68037.1 hypothetical protein N4264_25480 [Tahibacter amnicola]